MPRNMVVRDVGGVMQRREDFQRSRGRRVGGNNGADVVVAVARGRARLPSPPAPAARLYTSQRGGPSWAPFSGRYDIVGGLLLLPFQRR